MVHYKQPCAVFQGLWFCPGCQSLALNVVVRGRAGAVEALSCHAAPDCCAVCCGVLCAFFLQHQAELAKSKAELAELKDELKSAVKREASKVSCWV